MNRQERMKMMAQLDTYAGRYLALKEELRKLHDALYKLARAEGALLKDAPHSRIVGDVLYEVLATAATRTEVDQAAVRKFFARAGRLVAGSAFEAQETFALAEDWQRNLPRRWHRAARACLRMRPAKRLTVRPRKKWSAKTNAAVERKAA